MTKRRENLSAVWIVWDGGNFSNRREITKRNENVGSCGDGIHENEWVREIEIGLVKMYREIFVGVLNL